MAKKESRFKNVKMINSTLKTINSLMDGIYRSTYNADRNSMSANITLPMCSRTILVSPSINTLPKNVWNSVRKRFPEEWVLQIPTNVSALVITQVFIAHLKKSTEFRQRIIAICRLTLVVKMLILSRESTVWDVPHDYDLGGALCHL